MTAAITSNKGKHLATITGSDAEILLKMWTEFSSYKLIDRTKDGKPAVEIRVWP